MKFIKIKVKIYEDLVYIVKIIFYINIIIKNILELADIHQYGIILIKIYIEYKFKNKSLNL